MNDKTASVTYGRRDAARRQPPHHQPFNAAREPVHQAATSLGGGRVEQVGANGCRRMNAKQQATDASHADQQPDAEARKRVVRIDHAWIIANLHRLDPGDNEAGSITCIAGCCARTASGHAAAAPPSSVMKSRRFN
jgi:hypothetical protein